MRPLYYLQCFGYPCFIVLALLARENEKIKDVIAWSNWMDERMQSEEYSNALIYLLISSYLMSMVHDPQGGGAIANF